MHIYIYRERERERERDPPCEAAPRRSGASQWGDKYIHNQKVPCAALMYYTMLCYAILSYYPPPARRVSLSLYIYIYILVYVCVYIYIYMYVCVSLSLSLYLYIYIYIYMYRKLRISESEFPGGLHLDVLGLPVLQMLLCCHNMFRQYS